MNDKKRKKTGLGTEAFFQQAEEEEPTQEAEAEPEDEIDEQQQEKNRKKIRTSLVLYQETRAGLQMLKAHALSQGNRVTLSDIMNEAIQALMEEKGLEV